MSFDPIKIRIRMGKMEWTGSIITDDWLRENVIGGGCTVQNTVVHVSRLHSFIHTYIDNIAISKVCTRLCICAYFVYSYHFWLLLFFGVLQIWGNAKCKCSSQQAAWVLLKCHPTASLQAGMPLERWFGDRSREEQMEVFEKDTSLPSSLASAQTFPLRHWRHRMRGWPVPLNPLSFLLIPL